MKRNVTILTLCLALLVGLLLTMTAGAHPVAVTDSTRGDWFGNGPPASNIGTIVRDSTFRGEFVWTDAKADQRVASPVGATGNITPEADLIKFNVTADTSNLYFLVKMNRISGLSNDPSPEVMIAIDNDSNHTMGTDALPDSMATKVDDQARWEYVVETQFTKTAPTANPKIYASPSMTGTISMSSEAQLLSAAVRKGSFIEIKVPWDQIGNMPAQQNSLRFTVLSFYSDKRVPSDGIDSGAIDVLSPQSTAAELSGDNTINYYVDLHFNASGDVFAPLLISEFLPDPPTTNDPQGEWIEIYNPNSFDVSLQGYKIGDQAYRSGNQGMVQLPAQPLPHGQAVVVANNASVFQLRYPTVPAGKIIDMNTLTSYPAWASGVISLQNTNNGNPFKESIALLDPQDTIVDLVQYSTPVLASRLDPDNQPIILTGTSVAPNASYDRCPSSRDTNNGEVDFYVHTDVTQQTPGQPCQGVPGIDLRIAKTGPDTAAAGATIQYIISFSNDGDTAASSVVITDTLPSGVTCVSQSSSPIATSASGCPGGPNLSWTYGSMSPHTIGSITVNALISPTAGSDVTLVNRAGIRSTPAEAANTLGNNFTTQTLITAGPPDLSVQSTWPTTSVTPGDQFSYTINYANNGADDASGIVITDFLPNNVTLVSQSAPGASFNNATSSAPKWTIDTLASGDSGTITLVVQVLSSPKTGTPLTNKITISDDQIASDPTPGNNTEIKSATVGQHKVYLPVLIR